MMKREYYSLGCGCCNVGFLYLEAPGGVTTIPIFESQTLAEIEASNVAQANPHMKYPRIIKLTIESEDVPKIPNNSETSSKG